MFGGRRVAVRDRQYACDGHGDGEDLVKAQLVFQQWNTEGICEECGAVVDGGQVAGRCEIDRDIPGATCNGQGGCNESRCLEDIASWGGMCVAGGEVDFLRLDHLGGGADDGFMATPEGLP